MTADKPVRWFQRHPAKFITLLLMALFLLLDFSLGQFFCPEIVGEPDAFYHHGLPANFDGLRDWGDRQHRMFTNSLGFKDSFIREVNRDSAGHRVILIGDSFTEGVGYPFEETFAGIFAAALAPSGTEVLNAAVISYSPKLYYLKTRYLLQNMHLRFDELIVFLDYSDIQDEIKYEAFVPSADFGISQYYFVNLADSFLKKNFFTYWKLRDIVLSKLGYFDGELFAVKPEKDLLVNDQEFADNWSIERNQWEYNQRVYEKWGKKGLELASRNMESLYRLCRKHGVQLTIAVYPWPNQIVRRDLSSQHVTIWKEFCTKRGLNFINYYPIFIDEEDSQSVLEKYFIPGDVHWNRQGHQLIAKVLLESRPGSAAVAKSRP